jgi:hypothetical protein
MGSRDFWLRRFAECGRLSFPGLLIWPFRGWTLFQKRLGGIGMCQPPLLHPPQNIGGLYSSEQRCSAVSGLPDDDRWRGCGWGIPRLAWCHGGSLLRSVIGRQISPPNEGAVKGCECHLIRNMCRYFSSGFWTLYVDSDSIRP